MRPWLVICLAAVMSAPLIAEQSSQDLPSAPSATLQQEQERQKQQQAPPQPTPPPAKPDAPAAQPGGNAEAAAPNAGAQPAASASAASTPTTAADAPASTNDALETFVVKVNEVNVIFTVVDKRGRFVRDLKREDFKFLDNNRPPEQIRGFSSQTDLPLRVGLLVDASNSIRDRFKFEQEAAIEFLNTIVRPKSDLAFVLGFDSTAEVTQDFTNDTEDLSKGVRQLRPGGGTAMYDAVYYACRDKLLKDNTSRYATRRAVILISDGEDNQSRVTREEAVEMAQRAEVIVYAISTNISGTRLRGDKVLERFADATGGRVFFPFKLQDVADAFSEIQSELRSQYAVAYKPSEFKMDGQFRTIAIEAEKRGLKVRARKGYYAPNQ
jgi:Ca-activated chloride channel homolog